MHHFRVRFITLFTLLFAIGCSNNDSSNSPFPNREPIENPTINYTNATLYYYGDEGDTGESCEFELRLYTDMDIDELGNPIGPGHLLSLNFNATLFEDGATDFAIPEGIYRAAPNNYSYPPFSFNYGYEEKVDLPTGIISLPRGSFYGELKSGETQFTADLLNEGAFSVERDGSGIYTIQGRVVGNQFLKRNFIFKGELKAKDNSEEKPLENSNLTTDITLNNLTQARLQDLGDIFFIQDNSYRAFELHLASEDCNLEERWPTTGEYLQILLLVDWSADVNSGIPQGEYLAPEEEAPGGGLYRDDIKPYIIRPGVPDKFTYPSGSWYMSYSDSVLSKYGRLNGGRVVVERSGEAHTIRVELNDCSDSPHMVEALFEQTSPIEVFKVQI